MIALATGAAVGVSSDNRHDVQGSSIRRDPRRHVHSQSVLLWLLPATSVIPSANTPLERSPIRSFPLGSSYVLLAVVLPSSADMRLVAPPAAACARECRTNLCKHGPAHRRARCRRVALLILVFNAYKGVPTPTVIVLTLLGIMAFVTTQTPLGRHIYAMAATPKERGVQEFGPARHHVVFAMSGFLAAPQGSCPASRQLGVSVPNSDLTLLLEALGAVVIGGVSLFGGRGSVWAAVMGALVIGSISNGLYLLNASTQVRWAIEGLVLVVAVVIDSSVSRPPAAQDDG